MEKFTVRIKPIKRGVRTYYEPQMQRRFLKIPYWIGFSAYKHCGGYNTRLNNYKSYSSARSEIADLEYVYGEENVTQIPCDKIDDIGLREAPERGNRKNVTTSHPNIIPPSIKKKK